MRARDVVRGTFFNMNPKHVGPQNGLNFTPQFAYRHARTRCGEGGVFDMNPKHDEPQSGLNFTPQFA